MRIRRLLPLALVAGIAVLVPAAASANSGTFSGTITATSCGPMHAIQVAQGDTNIDVVASADVAANDITLELYDPNGNHVAHGDTLTSPEEILYGSDSLQAGTWNAQVCPFPGGVLVEPATYTGVWSTSGGPALGTPGSTSSGTSATPSVKHVDGKLNFSPAIVVDPQRTEGEPLNFWDGAGNYWESGPWGTSTAQSFMHRSTDGGQEFHIDSPVGLRSDTPPGGGDTDITVDDQGNAYFVDLEGLVNLGTSVSNDNGDTWRKNPLAVENTAVDRQWFAIDNGTTSSADDNTIFLAFHEAAVGTFIYSSPGSKGPDDAVGGLVWQNASANAPEPLASDATCGQPRFDPVKRNLYSACSEGDHVRITVGHVDPGQRTGIHFRNVALPKSPGGGSPGHLFPAVATDDGGNVYAAWIDENDGNVYYSYSTDEGSTWSQPAQVNAAPAVTNEFLWAQGGSAGTVALAWLGTDAQGQPDDFPSWYADPQAAPSVKWYGYVSVISNAASLKPTAAQQRFSEKPTHFGSICNSGIGCTENTTSDRTMADFFGFSLDAADAMQIVFTDTTSQHHGAHLFAVRQLGPKTLHGRKLQRATPSNPMSDPAGDAQWPHYSPTGAGPNQPQLDFTNLVVSQPDPQTLRVRMTLSDLSSLLPPPGKTNAVWLTRFQTLSTGDSGEESYPIFYLGAESVGGGTPQFFAGTTTCTDTTPQNCKVVNYPAATPVAGKVCGNTIQVDAPLSAFARPFDGSTLFSVTGLAFGRDAADDLYADVDATHAFDYTLGSNVSTAGC